MQINPDYTMSYQILMYISKIHKISKSLSVLRYQDLETGYGNGSSFMKKLDHVGIAVANLEESILLYQNLTFDSSLIQLLFLFLVLKFLVFNFFKN